MRTQLIVRSISIAVWWSLVGLEPAKAAEFSLKGTGRNGIALTPTSTISAEPGDRVTAEVFVCGWNADESGSRVRTLQVTLDVATGALSGVTGSILPNGWDAPFFPTTCDSDADCPDPEYPVCSASIFRCVGPDFNPVNPLPNPPNDDGTFIDAIRSDFVLQGFQPIAAIRFWDINISFGATSVMGTGPADPGCANPKYAGTINFVISPDACGSFVLGFRSGVEESFLELVQGPSDPESLVVPPTAFPLTINVGSNCPIPLEPVDTTCHAGAVNLEVPCATNDDCGPTEFCSLKSRFLSVRVAGAPRAGPPSAIGVLVVDSPNPEQIGDMWWAGPGLGVLDAPTPFVASALECTPVPIIQVWSALSSFHVYGEAVVPGARYEIRNCTATRCTPPLIMDTGVYGDVAAPFGAAQPNFGDISAQVATFQGTAGLISLTRALLRPSLLDPSTGTSFVQISATVSAFQGFPYSDPPSTPGANRCP